MKRGRPAMTSDDKMITKQLVISARLNAIEFLATHRPGEYSCCGQPLAYATGQCSHRSHHATPAYENITDYPEQYDTDGRYIGPVTKSA